MLAILFSFIFGKEQNQSNLHFENKRIQNFLNFFIKKLAKFCQSKKHWMVTPRTNSPPLTYLLDPHTLFPPKLVTSFLPTYPPPYLPTYLPNICIASMAIYENNSNANIAFNQLTLNQTYLGLIIGASFSCCQCPMSFLFAPIIAHCTQHK